MPRSMEFLYILAFAGMYIAGYWHGRKKEARKWLKVCRLYLTPGLMAALAEKVFNEKQEAE